MFTTQMYNPDEIIDPTHEDFLQYFEVNCPHCDEKVRLCVPASFTDWKSAYDEMKNMFYKQSEWISVKMESLEKENKKLKKYIYELESSSMNRW